MKLNFLKFKFWATSILAGSTFAQGGFYAGIGGGYSSLNNQAQAPWTFNSGATSETGGAPAVMVYAGYDFNQIVGFEANYLAAINGSTSSYSATQQLLGGSLLVHFPFSIISDNLSGLSVFGRGGLDYNMINFSNIQNNCTTCVIPPGNTNGFTPRYGAGVEYGLKNIGYRLEWNYAGSLTATNQGSNEVNMSSSSFLISILYHF